MSITSHEIIQVPSNESKSMRDAQCLHIRCEERVSCTIYGEDVLGDLDSIISKASYTRQLN